jgi:hypothetical protein
MAHRARLGCIVIDCPADRVDEAAAFWAATLGGRAEVDEDGKYAEIDGQGDVKVLVQAVDHPARVHLDIEADDKEAEVARLEALGARAVARIKGWIVMEAPTGHRFCIVNPQQPEVFDRLATEREG